MEEQDSENLPEAQPEDGEIEEAVEDVDPTDTPEDVVEDDEAANGEEDISEDGEAHN